MHAANRVALNTGILYVRMLLTMAISLYTTRLILNALGEVDYGIFNLIAGVIAMLSFLNTAMATSTQRYLSYHQGRNDIVMQTKVFGNSIVVHVLIGLVIIAGLEIAGYYFLDGFLKIPANRMEAARVVYHYMSATVFFTIVSVPFLGSLTAHENMFWVAVVTVVETFLKLGIALFLFITTTDKLVVYGLLTASISIVSFLLYALYCIKRFPECDMRSITSFDKSIVKELTSFAGWNLFGSLCSVGRSQGLAILLNIFFGTVVNAAYGIANQVSAQLTFFSATMLRTLNPQIMKSEGANDRKRMLRLSMMASKFGFYLLAVFAIPCIFEMHNVLSLWLKDVPEYTVIFCQWILIGTMINQLTIGLQSALQATGKIKIYQVTVGTTLLLNLPVAFILLKLQYPAYSVLVSYAIIEAISCNLRLLFARNIAGLSVKEYFQRVISKEIIPVVASVVTCFLVTTYMQLDFRFLITGFFSAVIFIGMIYFSGLCEDEKVMIDGLVQKITSLVFKKEYI